MKIILAPSYLDAVHIVDTEGQPEATVEAEYGEHVIQGTRYTLAHHAVKYANNPAPCLLPNQEETFDGTILISHLDLDTIGGCLAILGIKPENDAFWHSAAYIDTYGMKYMSELPENVQEQLCAYYAYMDDHFCYMTSYNFSGVKKAVQLTNFVIGEAKARLSEIFSYDENLICQGSLWKDSRVRYMEDCLIYEDAYVRVFKTFNTDCCEAFTPPDTQQTIPAVVQWNTTENSLSLSLADGGNAFSAVDVVQQIWGMEAGGHPWSAGSPRGWKLGPERMVEEMWQLVRVVKEREKNG